MGLINIHKNFEKIKKFEDLKIGDIIWIVYKENNYKFEPVKILNVENQYYTEAYRCYSNKSPNKKELLKDNILFSIKKKGFICNISVPGDYIWIGNKNYIV